MVKYCCYMQGTLQAWFFDSIYWHNIWQRLLCLPPFCLYRYWAACGVLKCCSVVTWTTEIGKKEKKQIFFLMFALQVVIPKWKLTHEIFLWKLWKFAWFSFVTVLLFLKSSFLWSFKSESSPIGYHQQVQTFHCVCSLPQAEPLQSRRSWVAGRAWKWASPSSQVAFTGWESQLEQSVLFWVYTWPHQALVQNKMTI